MSKKAVQAHRIADEAQQDLLRLYLHDLCQLLDAQCAGALTDLALAQVGLQRGDLQRHEQRLSFETYFRLLGWLHATRAVPAVFTQLGLMRRLEDYGPYGHALRTVTCLLDVLRLAERFVAVTWSHTSFSVHVQRDVAVCRYDILPGAACGEEPLLLMLTAMSMGVGLATLPATPWSLAEVRYGFAAPPDAARCRELLGCKVVFNAPHTEFRLPAGWMRLPMTSEAPSGRALAEALTLYRAGQSTRDAAQQVAQQLEHGHAKGFPTMPQVARALGWSERTLARRLAQEHTSYRHELDRVRMQLARRYLTQTSLSLAEIAAVLGYAHQPSFQRAFRGCFDATPQEVRQHALAARGSPTNEEAFRNQPPGAGRGGKS